MHHAHVNDKEHTMRPFTLQEYHDNPELQRKVRARASRERANAVHAAFAWLWRRVLAAAAAAATRPQSRSTTWAARLG
jgi:hypothetical protein